MESTEVKKEKTPVGIILILVLMGLGVIGSISTSINLPMLQVGPFLYYGTPAIICFLILGALAAFAFYGIIKRLKWGWTLTMLYYSLSLLLGMANFIAAGFNIGMYREFYAEHLPANLADATSTVMEQSFIITFSFNILINLVIFIYLTRKKDYFIHG